MSAISHDSARSQRLRRWTAGLGAGAAAVATWRAAAGAPELAWIAAEWPSALGHLEVSVHRLLAILAIAAAGGLPVAAAMRRWPRVETALTPALLTAVAVPWVLIAVALNMMVHLRLGASGALALAAVGTGAWLVAALGPRRQATVARRQRLRRAVRTALLMLLAAELLALGQGLGAQLRFYVLYWSPVLLALYAALLITLGIAVSVVGRVSARPLTGLTARLAPPPG